MSVIKFPGSPACADTPACADSSFVPMFFFCEPCRCRSFEVTLEAPDAPPILRCAACGEEMEAEQDNRRLAMTAWNTSTVVQVEDPHPEEMEGRIIRMDTKNLVHEMSRDIKDYPVGVPAAVLVYKDGTVRLLNGAETPEQAAWVRVSIEAALKMARETERDLQDGNGNVGDSSA